MAKEPVEGKPSCPTLELDSTTVNVLRCMRMVESGLIGVDDMDGWYYHASEFAAADKSRALQPKDDK